MMVTVAEIGETVVTVDGNHPLAGVNLNFAVTVREMRQATEGKLAQGHTHSPGGHSHREAFLGGEISSMARNRMTFEKHQRDAKKKRKAEEKRALRRKKKEQAQTGPAEPETTGLTADESTED